MLIILLLEEMDAPLKPVCYTIIFAKVMCELLKMETQKRENKQILYDSEHDKLLQDLFHKGINCDSANYALKAARDALEAARDALYCIQLVVDSANYALEAAQGALKAAQNVHYCIQSVVDSAKRNYLSAHNALVKHESTQ